MGRKKKTEDGPNGKIRVGKAKDFKPIVFRVNSIPADQIKQKFARNRCLQVCKSWFDFENRTLNFEHMKNADESIIKTYSFAEVAEDFGWIGFSFENNFQTIIPKWNPDGI